MLKAWTIVVISLFLYLILVFSGMQEKAVSSIRPRLIRQPSLCLFFVSVFSELVSTLVLILFIWFSKEPIAGIGRIAARVVAVTFSYSCLQWIAFAAAQELRWRRKLRKEKEAENEAGLAKTIRKH